ncbi:MAG: hypothetical protein WBQ10_19550 [Terriglobales bacterium]
MGHSRPLSSKPSKLSESCNRRLNAYALAASAAGLGLFTVAPRADAKIIYTPANLPLMNQQQVFFDLNHDGINDFSFYGRSISRRSISTFFFRLTVSPAQQGNAIWGVESHEHASCAAALPRGTRVGPKRPFQPNRVVLFDSSGGPNGGTAYCPWGGKIGTAYVGLKFSIKGQTHFGWARVKIASMYPYKIFLTGYAYETIPNKPIVTGETKGPDDGTVGQPAPATLGAPMPPPVTLGILALGSPALSIWRRRDSA